VEEKIELRDHVLTIGPNGKIRASIFAKSAIIVGEVVGNITCTEKVDLRDNGSVDGDIIAPRMSIAEGAHFRGSVDVKRGAAAGQRRRRPRSRAEPPKPEPPKPAQLSQRRSPAWRPSRIRAPRRWASSTQAAWCRASRPGRPGQGCSDARVRGAATRKNRCRSPSPRRRVYLCHQGSQVPGDARSRPDPVLLDLGPVIGSNVSFFGEQLRVQIFVEDVYADIDRHDRAGTTGDLAAFLAKRFAHTEGSIDGILCWDLLDFLNPASAQVVATALSRMLAVDGALLGFFSTATAREATFVKYVVVDDLNLRHRPYGPQRMRSRVLQNRDIIKLFERLRVSDSFLLQTNIREILFRKPAYLASP
jgi:hypothetical protein